MPEEPRRPIMGEIVSVEEGGGEVRLASGEVGWLPRPMDAKLQEKFRLGSCTFFDSGVRGADGRLLLSLASEGVEDESHAFDREFDRLNNALTNHQTVVTNHQAEPLHPGTDPEDPVDEERIKEWIARVGETVASLRKNRAQRLNEQI